ncbi:hypothetical protein BGP_3095 [Beggiatoa sp. PS]|nr:hypothetical protein BGP_3095 [Beggiatoa sp. PS]
MNDPTQQVPLFINTTAGPTTINLGNATYQDLDGKTVTGSLNLKPFSSQILILVAGEPVNTEPPVSPVEPPVSPVEPPVSPAEPPVSPVEPPVSPIEPPVSPVEPPVSPVEPPISPVEPPVSPAEPPVSPAEPPDETVEQPISPFEPLVEPPTFEEKMATLGATAPNKPSRNCPTTGKIDKVCRNQTQVITDTILDKQASIAGGELAGTIENQGLISNVTVQPEAQVNGGKLTGSIINQGTLANIEFLGNQITGGTLSGTITNNSQVGGTLKDVQLAPQTRIKGGYLQGDITGDADEPALLENLTIKGNSHLTNVSLAPDVIVKGDVTLENVYLAADSYLGTGHLQGNIIGDSNAPALLENVDINTGSYLENITLGSGISIASDVTFGETVQVGPLPMLGSALATDEQGESVQRDAYFAGGLTFLGGPFGQAVTHQLIDEVNIDGRILVSSEHIGQLADIFVYVAYKPLDAVDGEPVYVMLDRTGNIYPWEKGDVEGLISFANRSTLNSIIDVPIYSGQIPVTGIVNISFGYRLSTGKIVYNLNTIDVTITE